MRTGGSSSHSGSCRCAAAGGAVEPHQPVSELTAPGRPRRRCKRPPPEQKKHERVDMKAARHSVFDRDSPTQERVFVVVAVFF